MRHVILGKLCIGLYVPLYCSVFDIFGKQKDETTHENKQSQTGTFVL